MLPPQVTNAHHSVEPTSKPAFGDIELSPEEMYLLCDASEPLGVLRHQARTTSFNLGTCPNGEQCENGRRLQDVDSQKLIAKEQASLVHLWSETGVSGAGQPVDDGGTTGTSPTDSSVESSQHTLVQWQPTLASRPKTTNATPSGIAFARKPRH